MQSSFSAAAVELSKRISAAELCQHPFEHVIIPDLFPRDIYDLMVKNPIADRYLKTLHELKRTSDYAYPDRYVLPLSSNLPMLLSPDRELWQQVYEYVHYVISPALLNKFSAVLQQRFDRLPNMQMDMLYVRDRRGYQLGPHTDSPRKICSFLIYLAHDDSQGPGTSFYWPKDPTFRCAGGPHYHANQFDLVQTMPYQANLLCAFAKSDRSFHGVEPIVDNCQRNLLICDIQIKT